jgi:hypothetical protein
MLKSSRWSTAPTSSGLPHPAAEQPSPEGCGNRQPSAALGNAALVFGRSAEPAAMTN